MISSRRSRSACGSRPSAESASPSRCSIPVNARSTATATPAAEQRGQDLPLAHHTHPDEPRRAPRRRAGTTPAHARAAGRRAAEDGEESRSASRDQGSQPQLERPGDDEEHVDRRHGRPRCCSRRARRRSAGRHPSAGARPGRPPRTRRRSAPARAAARRSASSNVDLEVADTLSHVPRESTSAVPSAARARRRARAPHSTVSHDGGSAGRGGRRSGRRARRRRRRPGRSP